MFLRYFYLVGGGGVPRPGTRTETRVTFDEEEARVSSSETDYDDIDTDSTSDADSDLEDGLEIVTWDTAVACLALSVKVGSHFCYLHEKTTD